ncbi:DUF7344 domain-containing protein [Haladaptatus sp. NG-SE-30]
MCADSSDTPKVGLRANGNGSDRLDATMELLADRRRRQMLYHLRARGGSVEFDELVDRIAIEEGRTTENDYKRIRTEFRHKHLPKMKALGVIERDDDEIRLSQSVSSIEPYLDLAADFER